MVRNKSHLLLQNQQLPSTARVTPVGSVLDLSSHFWDKSEVILAGSQQYMQTLTANHMFVAMPEIFLAILDTHFPPSLNGFD